MVSMSTLAILMIVWMFLLANLPFISRRVCWNFWPKTQISKAAWHKPFGWCVLEILVYYAVFILSHLLISNQFGYLLWQPFSFYAITFLIFIAMAFFGLGYRFLYRR